MYSFEEIHQANITFLQNIKSSDSMTKEAQISETSKYLKAQVYEESFMERILPAQTISPLMTDRDPDSPNARVVIDKEFKDVKAVTTTFRGSASYNYAENEKYAVEFFKIESEEVSLREGEIRDMRQPIQNIIRHRIAYEIRKKMDEMFIGMCNAAIAASGNQLDLTGTGEKTITPENLIDLRNLIDDQSPQYLEAATILMTKAQYNNVSKWIQANTAAGAGTMPGMAGGITNEFWKDGYVYDKLFGLRVIVTQKSDLLPSNRVLLFTEPEYLGHHFTYNDDRLAIEHKWDILDMKGWRTFAAAIGNVNAVAELILDV